MDSNIYIFDDWLRENGIWSYRKTYDVFVSQGDEVEEIDSDYEELEKEFSDWCEDNGFTPWFD